MREACHDTAAAPVTPITFRDKFFEIVHPVAFSLYFVQMPATPFPGQDSGGLTSRKPGGERLPAFNPASK